MSKSGDIIRCLILLAVTPLCVLSQQIVATIRTDLVSPSISVNGRFDRARKNLSFLDSIVGIKGLAARVTELELFDANGKSVAYKKLIDGEYLADSEFVAWKYRVDLTPLRRRDAAAHASWFAGDSGILMTADVLPLTGSDKSAQVSFTTPRRVDQYPDPIYSSEPRDKAGSFSVADIETAVFYFGSGWEIGNSLEKPFAATILVSGSWTFGITDPWTAAKEIADQYESRFGKIPGGRPIIAVAKFPIATPPGEWQAETRGRSVTIISSDMPFKSQSLQRLHEQLRHELFHLWIPNGLNLTGNYDWFYEGFALYESLKLGLRVNRISFADFLDTLSRAHTIDSAIPPKMSLIQASTNRFGGSNTQVYARGMLVAFLTDVELVQRSKGKRSIEDVLVEVMRWHRKPQPEADGNAAVIKILRNQAGAGDIVDKYVEGTEVMNLSRGLSAAGIEDSDPGSVTSLRVKEKLSSRQKDLLDKLGYNNWRKLSGQSK